MKRDLITDNWTLQDVNELLVSGLSPTPVGQIALSQDKQSHTFANVPAAVIQLDCLLTLITNLVIYDELIVDQAFINTWDQEHPQLSRLTSTSLVKPVVFDPNAETLAAVREEIVDRMAVTPSLKAVADENRKSWELTGQATDPHMSAVLWGGAGMLARSHLLSAPYFGHPFRRALITESGFLAARRDAWARTEEIVSAARTKMFRFRHSEIDGALASFNLPPIAVQVIEAASSADDLLLSAITLRDKYATLREWLSTYRDALESEDEKKLSSNHKLLTSIAKSIEKSYRANEDSSTDISLSVGFLGIGIPIPWLNTTINRFGIRSGVDRSRLTVSRRESPAQVDETLRGREV
ncbi:MAG: hypothetical protein WDO12_01630 [Pseudomonadota bacterium]